MKTRLLTTTAIAMLIAFSASATTYTTEPSPTVGERIDSGVAATGQAIEEAAEKVRDMLADRDSTGAYGMVVVDKKASMAGLIGESVHGPNNKAVAEIEDILITKNGEAAQMILTNGGIMGMGAKLVAVDFGLVYVRSGSNAMLVPLTDTVIKSMAPFSYDASDAKDGMRTIPDGYLSANAMLKGSVYDGHGTRIGSVEDISLQNGRAGHVVFLYGSTFGAGGTKLAVAYDQLQKMGHDATVDFKLSDALTDRFEVMTRTAN